MLRKSATALAVFIVLCPPLLLADAITNGSFETGNFAGWSTIGDTLVVKSSFGTTPPDGVYQALMSTAPDQCCSFNDFPNPGYPFTNGTFSGTTSVDTVISLPNPTAFDNFFGLPAAPGVGGIFSTLPPGCPGLPALACNTYEGSGIKQSFYANNGDTLSFDFDYLTNETMFDYAFVVVDGVPSYLFGFENLGTCTSYPFTFGLGSPTSPTGFTTNCGEHSYQISFTNSGIHTIGIGIVDSGTDAGVDSALLVDNFVVTAVPEPSTLLLLASGIVGMGFLRRYFGNAGGRA